MNLLTFFRAYVHRYFCWQIVCEEDKGSKHLPGWKHSDDGIREFYHQFLNTDDVTIIKSKLLAIFHNRLPGPGRESRRVRSGHSC